MIRRIITFLAIAIGLTVAADQSIAARLGNLLSPVGHIGGETKAIAIEDHYAYVGEGLGLTVMDISNPRSPVVVGRTPPFAEVELIAPGGNYVYVAAHGTGRIWVIDVSDPTTPKPLYKDINYNVQALAIDGSYLYMGTMLDGLHIYDLASPVEPKEVGHMDIGQVYNDLAANDGYIFTADAKRGLAIVDVSDPTQPEQVALVELEWPSTPNAVAAAGDYVYTEYDNIFRVIDVSDPTKPVETGSVDIWPGADHIQIAGEVAFANASGTLFTLDISDPHDPQLLKEYQTEDNMTDLAVTGDYVYFTSDASDIRVLDVSDPAQPAEVYAYDLVRDPRAVVVDGGHAYITDDQEGLVVVDVSDATLPRPVGHYQSPNDSGAEGLFLEGNILYLATSFEGLRVLDISDPESPTEIGAYRDLFAYDVAVQDGIAYVVGGELTLLDVSDPTEPILIAEYGFNAFKIEVADDKAYTVGQHRGLRILDISDPLNVAQVGEFFTINQEAKDLALMGDYVLIAASPYYTQVLDVTDPANIQLVSEYASHYAPLPSSVAAKGTRAYVGAVSQLEVVDLSNPAEPVQLDQLKQIGFFVTDIYADDELIYAAGSGSGLYIFTDQPVAPGSERLYLPLVHN